MPEELSFRKLGPIVEAQFSYGALPSPFTYFAAYGLRVPERLSQAIAKRKIEFLAGRLCALEAIKKLGFTIKTTDMLRSSEDRQPIWPNGVTGSITHSSGLAAAMVVPSQKDLHIGLDVEALMSEASDALIKQICLPHEWTQRNIRLPAPLSLTLIFSLKESLYKALYPQVKKFFGFDYAKVDLSYYPDYLTITLVKDLPGIPAGTNFRGYCNVNNNICKTWVQIRKLS